MYIYFDESKSKDGKFVIGSFVFCKDDPDEFIFDTLFEHGLFPGIDEFKSGVLYRDNPEMGIIRNKLKGYFYEHCKFGLVVLPLDHLNKLGEESLKALQQFIETNEFSGTHKIYFDQEIFASENHAQNLIAKLGLEQHEFFFEQNSKDIHGIQLADLNAHCLSIILKQQLGLVDKKITPHKDSGYSQEERFPIGFEMWASLRYSFLLSENPVFDAEGAEMSDVCQVEPYGLFLSDLCTESLKAHARKVFATVYLGCIH